MALADPIGYEHDYEEYISAPSFISDIYSQVMEFAPLSVDILLEGETGVGKDTMAKRIHELSHRRGAFVALNCAAIPESLAESELFGVEAGAYTGAVKSRPGKFEAANGGTLYLDEIDSMPLSLQAKLLRALQDRGCERLGSHTFIPSDFRVIASTKIPLDELVAQGKFREDLYYRLNIIVVKIPPLREERGHIPELFRHFVTRIAHDLKRIPPDIPTSLEMALISHSWPGNVRELLAAAQRHVIGRPALPTAPAVTVKASLKEHICEIERTLIRQVLIRNKGCVRSASKELGMSEHTLHYRIRRLGIELDTESTTTSRAAPLSPG